MSINHFERKVQPELKLILCGQLVLVPASELERWVQRHAHLLVEIPRLKAASAEASPRG